MIRYKVHTGVIPTEGQGLEALVRKPTTDPVPSGWRQFVDSSLLVDPWQSEYQYRVESGEGFQKVILRSLGPDRKPSRDDRRHEFIIKSDQPGVEAQAQGDPHQRTTN